MTATDVDFDRATGRLRLTHERFAELITGRRPSAALEAAGVVSSAGLHPLLTPGIAAVRGPICQLQIVVAGVNGRLVHEGWLAAEAASFLLHTRDDTYEFLTTGPTFVPAAIVRVLRLAPRPPLSFLPFETSPDLVDDLLAVDETKRPAALAAVVQGANAAGAPWQEAVGEGRWRASRTVLSWLGHDGEPTGRDLTLLDCPAGVIEARRRADGATQAAWAPATTTGIWRAITALLPGDEELSVPPDPAR